MNNCVDTFKIPTHLLIDMEQELNCPVYKITGLLKPKNGLMLFGEILRKNRKKRKNTDKSVKPVSFFVETVYSRDRDNKERSYHSIHAMRTIRGDRVPSGRQHSSDVLRAFFRASNSTYRWFWVKAVGTPLAETKSLITGLSRCTVSGESGGDNNKTL